MRQRKKVLITGGTGLIGSRLLPMLKEKGYNVVLLSRSQRPIPGVQVSRWSPLEGQIDPDVVENTYAVIHLAGANLAEKRWTSERKREIIDSRVKPLELLAQKMREIGVWPKILLSASGTHLSPSGNTEPAANGKTDFLTTVIKEWEGAADILAVQGVRTVKFRTGVVLDNKKGALPKMALPVKLGLGTPIGSGNQWLQWIHLTDICRLYCKALENDSYEGSYHAIAPEQTTNRTFVRTLCRILNRPFWPVPLPAFVLKTLLGEMSTVLLEGRYLDPSPTEETIPFTYTFPTLKSALTDLYIDKRRS
jgi:uncharacterized protein (TIGR01777 family)